MFRSVASFSFALLLALVFSLPSRAQAFSLATPEARGVAFNLGQSYDPKPAFGFTQLSLMALYDYAEFWHRPAPQGLRFKLEGSIGIADDSRARLLMSVNMLVHDYIDFLRYRNLRPYYEAGIGIVYNDFQVDGQGLRINFNPQAGIGVQVDNPGCRNWYLALRAYHISNANLHHDNRGINAVMLQTGLMF